MGLATNPTSLHKTDVECTKSLTPEKKTRKLNRTDFSLRMKSDDFFAAAAKYYKVFPDNAQPDSHQLLQYCQQGPSPKGKEEPWCREAIERGRLSGEANCRSNSKAIVP